MREGLVRLAIFLSSIDSKSGCTKELQPPPLHCWRGRREDMKALVSACALYTVKRKFAIHGSHPHHYSDGEASSFKQL